MVKLTVGRHKRKSGMGMVRLFPQANYRWRRSTCCLDELFGRRLDLEVFPNIVESDGSRLCNWQRQLERVNPSAARSLEEGMEETLTVQRLGVGESSPGREPLLPSSGFNYRRDNFPTDVASGYLAGSIWLAAVITSDVVFRRGSARDIAPSERSTN